MTQLLTDGGELEFVEDFIAPGAADTYLTRLREDLDWREETLVIAGRKITAPRLVCWYGDAQANYRYSGADHSPLPWTAALLELKARVESYCGRSFNSVLGNFYRDGGDSLGWHADKEKALGPEPYIASLSFGAARRFDLRHNQTRQTLSLSLSHGSLLVMGGSLQRDWRHRVPKMPGAAGPRINLTFRTIFPTIIQAVSRHG